MKRDRYASAAFSNPKLREMLVYEPATGLFWKKPSLRTKAGYTPGVKMASGHFQIYVMGSRVLAHRLAWFYVHGVWPSGEIDHINGNPADNRLANLRDVPHAINMQNRRIPNANNKTGFLGVSPHQGRFVAGMSVDGRRRYLGIFDTAEEAHQVYLKEKRKHHAGMTL